MENNIEEILKAARNRSGMTQEEVAEKIQVSRVTLSHWETGKSLPDILSVLKLSDLYQLSLDVLLKGDTGMEKKIREDERRSAENQRLIRVIAIVCGILIAVEVVCMIVGGPAREFYEAALPWIAMGFSVAVLSASLGAHAQGKSSESGKSEK
ncbi:MAG: helix-turn-helix domain-containing protein [Eubacterium sp.]|nr:helix-turn-helix domain-containing protein [Eubacterium sp.]